MKKQVSELHHYICYCEPSYAICEAPAPATQTGTEFPANQVLSPGEFQLKQVIGFQVCVVGCLTLSTDPSGAPANFLSLGLAHHHGWLRQSRSQMPSSTK